MSDNKGIFVIDTETQNIPKHNQKNTQQLTRFLREISIGFFFDSQAQVKEDKQQK